jgi:hypothetical protein
MWREEMDNLKLQITNCSLAIRGKLASPFGRGAPNQGFGAERVHFLPSQSKIKDF